jgi:hypothetical protein
LDSNRQDPSETKTGSRGGRTTDNELTINWQSRAETIWDVHRSLRRSITELWNIALKIDARTIGSYEDFRRKFNGKRAASAAHAKILFEAGEFDQAGVSYSEWISSDEEWAQSARSLAPVNVIGFLAERAAKGTMQIAAISTPQCIPPEWRRLRDGHPVENELHVKEYLQLMVTFPGSSNPTPVHLLALEWSVVTRDWQIFNFVRASLLDIDKPEPLVIRAGHAVAQIPVGVRISGPLETFDLFVIAQRTPFDHQARSYLENLGRRADLSSLEMSRLIQLLFHGTAAPDVATTTYTVVD